MISQAIGADQIHKTLKRVKQNFHFDLKSNIIL